MASSEDQAASERLAALIAKSTLGTTAVTDRPVRVTNPPATPAPAPDVAAPAPSVEVVEDRPEPAPRVSTTAVPKAGL